MPTKQTLQAISLAAVLLTILQGIIPTAPINDLYIKTIFSACIMFAVSILTAYYQFASGEIDNKALIPTAIVFALAVLGSFNEFINVIHIPIVAGQWIRFIITVITAMLNVTSKQFYPQAK